ncbi:hypothetical protein MLD38_001870 [Melastoma candidum]|uniref:Uncharacterized protein n=1 Tax=Melastoma candidum TaxID=119954 RepID=A0ACB9SEQ5_9MYRT|nr:hypothetical protein MLD38_001870 [Melastoma candidum]
MEYVGAGVAPPIFLHNSMPAAYHDRELGKKRDYYNQSVSQQSAGKDWNPNSWQWDSSRFVVRPLGSEVLRPGMRHEGDNIKGNSNKPLERNASRGGGIEHDEDRLRLNLGGRMNNAEEPASRPNKRTRSGSPGDNYPMCQVDNCNEDLSNVKDYHRRHKVCEVHSKSANALVGKQMQRFCQQCSRFHLLSEFDEGKRSCRRRLAGHNRRRRKTQADDANSRVPGPANQVPNGNDADIVHLLQSLARGHGKSEAIGSSGLDREQIADFLGKISSLKLPVDLAAKLQAYRSDNVAASLAKSLLNHPDRFTTNPSTTDLLAALSSTQPAPSPNAMVADPSPSRGSDDPERSNKSKSADESVNALLEKGPAVDRSSVGGERSSTSYQSLVEDSDGQIQQTQPNLQLQLFLSSQEDDSPPKLASSEKYFSSEGSNPVEEQSPSSSPVIQELFPMQSLREAAVSERRMVISEVKESDDVRHHGHVKPLNLFTDSGRDPNDVPNRSSPYNAGSMSLSESDNLLSNANAQNRTGRIMFKLFEKDPSHLPGSLRSQIHNWLSNSPLDMESYIRPGCVVLSVYVSMSSSSWTQLEANLLERLYTFVQSSSDCEFWRNGRFLVYAGRKLASHKDGRIYQLKSSRASCPELVSVSPLAVAAGQETSLVLRGRNMNSADTKIFCTLMGGYMALEVSKLSSQTSSIDEVVINSFKVQTDLPADLGRCFIEVENGFRGSSFPVIVADAAICNELRLLESELQEDSASSSANEEMNPDFSPSSSQRDHVLHFLNELGWLFQRKMNAPSTLATEVALFRYKYLLTFAVERDYCALVKRILDLSLENCLTGKIPITKSLEALSEIQLLNRAVRRQCMKMVVVLLHFRIDADDKSSSTYLFIPDAVGPGGITPLHVAASISGSLDVVNALTNDPQEIGLNGWNSLLDSNGLSPHAYAMMRNNHSYNELVARKLADKEKCQISLTIEGQSVQDRGSNSHLGLEVQSCARCAAKSSKYARRVQASPRGVLHLPYMYSVLVIAAYLVCNSNNEDVEAFHSITGQRAD